MCVVVYFCRVVYYCLVLAVDEGFYLPAAAIAYAYVALCPLLITYVASLLLFVD